MVLGVIVAGTPLRVLVVADVHATTREPGDSAGSWVTTTTSRTDREHPILGLRALVESQDKPDLILCAGDLCDKSDVTALTVAWKDLHDLASYCGAQLIATAGNHDLDSRHNMGVDPRGALYDLDPEFPSPGSGVRDIYWARNYAIVDGPIAEEVGRPRWRVVTVNSAAFHGYTGEEGEELNHGRVSQRTVERLRDEMEELPTALTNILLIHHHLLQLPLVDLNERSQVREGEHLLQLLENTGPWTVIHGHKHRAFLMYGHGSGASAAIFSAGSLAAQAWGQLASQAGANQVYLLEFATEEELAAVDLDLAVKFKTWNWRPGQGWRKAGTDSSLPGEGGFGWRLPTRRVARQIANVVERSEAGYVGIDEIRSSFPKLRYVSPRDMELLTDELSGGSPSIRCTRDEHGRILGFGTAIDRARGDSVDLSGDGEVRDTEASA